MVSLAFTRKPFWAKILEEYIFGYTLHFQILPNDIAPTNV